MAFEQITQGPSGPTTLNYISDPNGFSFDNQNNVLATVGKSCTESVLHATLALFPPALPLTAITTAQTLLSQALNSWFLNRAGRILHLVASGVYSTTASNVATLTFTLTLGGVTICTITTTASNTTASTNLQWNVEFYLGVLATGQFGVLSSHGEVQANLSTATSAAVSVFRDTNVDPIFTATIGTNPAVADTITVNGTLVTFIVNGGTPVGNQVALGVSATATATALYTFLAASADVNIAKSTWTNPSAGVVVGTAKAAGFAPAAVTSVPAKITLSNTTVNLQSALTLALTIAASAAVPSATLTLARIEILA
jgi:hypothetical protein